MAHIKKVVIQGFKSFAKRTEIPFDKGINVIIGPNGGGKSNISDAICFVLGRLSVKSMRAEKAKNLIFMGSKYFKPAKEAFVEIYFDNSERDFAVDRNEVVLKRIVRVNGQSIYKIGDETKTRAEVIETLAQAGIDPYGFNIILQGQIQSIVKMQGDERRKIIGEVAGISVYEWRKGKSLKELEKTEAKLKEITTVLRERGAFLNNLEKEKAQAQKYRDLQITVRRAKASMLNKRLEDKKREVVSIVKALEQKMTQKDRKQESALKIQEEIEKISEKINEINRHIKDATGIEQSRLRDEITDIKASLGGLTVKKDGFENRREEVKRRIEEMTRSIPELEEEILNLKKESPKLEEKSKNLKKKKDELSKLEKQRKILLAQKTELNSTRERLEDKRKEVTRIKTESETVMNHIEKIYEVLNYKDEGDCNNSLNELRKSLEKAKEDAKEIGRKILDAEKTISVHSVVIRNNSEIKNKVSSLDICPLCKSKISEEHIIHVKKDCEAKIADTKAELHKARKNLEILTKGDKEIIETINKEEGEIRMCEKELAFFDSIKEKNDILKKYIDREENLRKEISELSKKRTSLEAKSEEFYKIDEKYEKIIHEIEEISSRTEEDVDTTLLYRERELEKVRSVIERSSEDLEDITNTIQELEGEVDEKEQRLEKLQKKEDELNYKFKQLFSERDNLQKKFQEVNLKFGEMQSEVRQIEEQMNYLKIGRAKLDGERETIEIDMGDYKGVKIIQGTVGYLEGKLKKAEDELLEIGSINMRALEVYDEIKTQYEEVKTKAETIQKEKEEVLKIIDEIDKKKNRTFIKTFKAINELFSNNFRKLSAKGIAYLEIEKAKEEDKADDDISESEVNIVVKLAKGKYFDVHSLSGGEQTLVALSLLFAIQEYKPYHFYILDEIDAALDKRNSERLAALLQQYTKTGQYIIVTHNDAVILDSDILYGVSMYEGVSKILSLKVGE